MFLLRSPRSVVYIQLTSADFEAVSAEVRRTGRSDVSAVRRSPVWVAVHRPVCPARRLRRTWYPVSGSPLRLWECLLQALRTKLRTGSGAQFRLVTHATSYRDAESVVTLTAVSPSIALRSPMSGLDVWMRGRLLSNRAARRRTSECYELNARPPMPLRSAHQTPGPHPEPQDRSAGLDETRNVDIGSRRPCLAGGRTDGAGDTSIRCGRW